MNDMPSTREQVKRQQHTAHRQRQLYQQSSPAQLPLSPSSRKKSPVSSRRSSSSIKNASNQESISNIGENKTIPSPIISPTSSSSIVSSTTTASANSSSFFTFDTSSSTASKSSTSINRKSSFRHQNFACAVESPTHQNINNALKRYHDTERNKPKTKLLTDIHHKPKTLGEVGLLIVGLCGKAGSTLSAGVLANRRKVKWRNNKGLLLTPNYNCCVTQQQQQQQGQPSIVKMGLANVSRAAIGGWDVIPNKLGDSLLDHQILDYDLTRQLHDEMNRIKVFRGYHVGTKNSSNKTHILTEKEAPDASEALKCLRADIRYFKWRNGVVGHTTVIYAPSDDDIDSNGISQQQQLQVEEEQYQINTAHDLLRIIEMSDDERTYLLHPSILYATAALLEGCSFVNACASSKYSANSSSIQKPHPLQHAYKGLVDLARNHSSNNLVNVYCLGLPTPTCSNFVNKNSANSLSASPSLILSGGFKSDIDRFKDIISDYFKTIELKHEPSTSDTLQTSSSSSVRDVNDDNDNTKNSSDRNENDLNTSATSVSSEQQGGNENNNTTGSAKSDNNIRRISNTTTRPYVCNERHDFVEYALTGFLNQQHNIVTYYSQQQQQEQKSININNAIVPLIIDTAVWCDYFSNRSWPYDKVINSLSYLFNESTIPLSDGVKKLFEEAILANDTKEACKAMNKISMNGSSGSAATAASLSTSTEHDNNDINWPMMSSSSPYNAPNSRKKKKRVRIRPEVKSAEWAIPNDGCVICAGLACVDMQLNQASATVERSGSGSESIETFEGERTIAGGSVSMSCKTLARLVHGMPLDESFMQVTPPVVHSVVPICKLGNDDTGQKLMSLLEQFGGDCRNVETKYIRRSSLMECNKNARTALAVLPIYKDGRRGCFFDVASNRTFSSSEVISLLQNVKQSSSKNRQQQGQHPQQGGHINEEPYYLSEGFDYNTPTYSAFLFGYPHLLPMMQGDKLRDILHEARCCLDDGGVIALDLNGVPEGTFLTRGKVGGKLRAVSDLRDDPVIGSALEHVDILHMNEDELALLTGCEINNKNQVDDEYAIASAINLFLLCGVAIVAVTRGKKGSFVSCGDKERFSRSPMLPHSWIDCTAKIMAVDLPHDTVVNTNGAGDAFTSGLLVATLLRHTGLSISRKDDVGESNDDDSNSISISSEGPAFSATRMRSPSKSPSSKSKNNPSSPSSNVSVGSPQSTSSNNKMTAYALYMRENYIALKRQLNDDKKAIFSRCHEMWENETDEVKRMYERRANEDLEDQMNEASIKLDNDLDVLDDSRQRKGDKHHSPVSDDDADDDGRLKNLYMANRALNLESAVQFASLVAAYHVDVSTRDLDHIDVTGLLERAMITPHGLEEI